MRILMLALLLSGANAMATCPDASQNETTLDCPWAEMAREFSAGKKSCDEIFKSEAPFMNEQLKKDSAATELLRLWGRAKNFDESAKGVIVSKEVLQCLERKLKLKNAIEQLKDFNVVHAGLQHTYAYLFSNLVTKYGFKRDRWVKDDLRLGLGLTPGLLSPQTKDGAFLSNVTFLFAKLTFGVKNLNVKKSVAKELQNLDVKKYEVRRLKETIPEKNISIHTDFVKLDTSKLSSKNSHLLIYWIEDLKTQKNYFISGFPVDSDTVERAFDPKALGHEKTITTRYNAWVPGVTDSGSPLTGHREEIK